MKSLILWTYAAILILVIIGSMYIWYTEPVAMRQNHESEVHETVDSSALPSIAVQHEVDLEQAVSWSDGKVPVIIYKEEVTSSEGSSGRSYPTIRIWRKVGAQPYEELATVGRVDEYPIDVSLSHNKKTLLINLESRLQLLDLETRELKDIFTPTKSTYLGAIFSPDDKELFIWDQFYAREDEKEYFVHRLNLETFQDTILFTGVNGSMYGPIVWREDNKIILYEPLGEFARSWYFDLETNQILQTPNSNMSGFVSRNGMLMSVVNSHVEDICNEFSGDAWSGYKILDPVTGALLGGLKQQWKPAGISAFSRDGKEILYSVGENVTSRENCAVNVGSSRYFTSHINGGSPKQMSYDSYMRTMNEWGYESMGAEEHYNYENNTYSITINNKPIVTSSKTLGIVAQYLK